MNSVSGLNLFRLLSFIVLLTAAQSVSYAQQTEADVKVQADKLFEEEKYVDATPLYSRLLALNPRSYDYNYRFGTCLLYNSYKKQDAFKYLNYAVTDASTDINAYYFLGKAYHLNYQFNEAIKNYELYKQKAGGKPKSTFEVDRQIEMCQNGKRLLTTISDLVVLQKTETNAKDFFRLYKLPEHIGGDIIVAADFQSKVDKKKGYVPIIHFPAQSNSTIYYASYGESDTGQKDIYMRRKLPDGSWSLPQVVGGSVNTKFDEDFPFMQAGSNYLYFCSKGHNSMGGYDIFRSKLDVENNTFGVPENMDFAISSPDNDLFFVVDSLDNNAYFASTRQSSNGNIHVYKVRVTRVPLQLAVVKGNFASTIHPENKKISVTVTDYASGEKIGTFSSNEKGSYLITFPKGGKYTYEMKVEGSTLSHKYLVSIPFTKEFKPLKQKILEETLDNAEVVRVVDLFNEEVEDPAGVLAEVIKQRSELNPNADQFDLEQLDANKENSKILAELGFENAGPGEIVAVFEELENKQEEKVKTNENLTNGALNQASDKLDQAAKNQEEAKNLVNRANAAPTKEQKFELLTQAQEKIEEATELKNDARELMAFSDSVTKQGTADKDLLASIQAVTAEVKKDVTADNVGDLKEVITGNSRTIQAVKEDNSSNPVDALIDQKTGLQKEKKAWSDQRDNYLKTEKQLEQEIAQLKADLPNARKKDVPAIESSINSKTGELNMVVEVREGLEDKIVKNTKKEEALDERIQFLQDVTDVKSSKTTTPSEVQSKLGAVDSKNNNTLASYIAQQVTDLKKDPSIQAIASGQDADPVVNELTDNYDNRVKEIESQGGSDPRSKEEALLAADRDLGQQVDRELAKVEETLKGNPTDEKAIKRREELKGLQGKTEDRITAREAKIAGLPENPPVAITPDTELAALAPNHDAALEAIDEGTPKEILEKKNDLDETLVGKIDQEIRKVEQQQQQNPNDPKLKERKTALTTLKTEAEERIKDRESLIATLDENPVAVVTPETELAALAPNHETELEAINESTPKGTLEGQNALDQTLIGKIDQEIRKVEQQQQQNPNDPKLEERKTALTALKTDVEDRIKDREETIANLDNPATAISPETELAALAPNHETELEAINESTPKGTLEGQNALDQTLIGKIDQEIRKVEQQQQQNPNDPKLEERKTALTALKTDVEDRIKDREETIANLDNQATAISPETELAALAPNHETELEAINESTPKGTLEGQNALDQTLIGKIDQEIRKVEQQQQQNPNDPKLEERKTALTTLKTDVEDRIKDREETIANLDNPATAISPETELAALAPNHETELEAINEGTPKETLEAQNALDQQLITRIDSELEDVEGQLLRNPENEQAKARETALRTLKTHVEERISDRSTELATIENANTPEDNPLAAVVAEVRPDYQKNIASIETKMEDGTAKELAILEEEQDLLDAINKAISQKEVELQKNPSNTKLLNEIDGLKAAQIIQEAKVEESEEELIAIEKAKIEPEQFIAQIDPKYQAPDVANRDKYTEAEIAKLTEQEKALQDKLIKRLNANIKKLEKGFDPKLAAENKIITGLMERSVNLQQTLNSPVVEDPAIAQRIAEELGPDNEFVMNQKPASIDEAKRMLTELHEYENVLTEQMEELQGTDPVDEEAVKAKNDQLKSVRRRIGVVEADLDEMESFTELAGNPNASEAEKELTQLNAAENELEARLNQGNMTPQEQRAVEKELSAVQTKKAAQETVVLKEDVEETKAKRMAATNELDQSAPAGDPLVSAVKQRSADLTNPTSEKPTKRELEDQLQQEEQASVLVATTNDYLDTKKIYDEEKLVTASPEELKTQRRRFSVEIGQLEAVIAAGKDDPKRATEVQQAQTQLTALKNAVATIDEMLSKLDEEQVAESPVKQGLQAPVSYEEEVKLAASPGYPALLQQYTETQGTKQQLESVVGEKEKVREQLAGASPEETQPLIEQLRDLSAEETALREELGQQERRLEAAVNATDNPDQMRNLLAREVAPVKQAPAAASVIAATLGDGFELVTTPAETRADKVIPVGTKAPSGLVYRVQVGAFAKPIPEDLFKEFTPVTGEKLNNGITRYLAGYFGNRNKVAEAQRDIRALGYSDAFVVAYCDGERITLAEARRLEDLGLCIPKNQDSLLMEIAENTLAQLPADSQARLAPVIKPSDYNKAPGAAAAEAAEEHKGLYFTVQVGVYNRPVPASQVKNIDPLVTKRLENGQIRYSSGIFHSVEEARPKRAEAIQRGITDAFITAYYQGERITIDEAKRILAEQGNTVLEPNTTVVPANAIELAKEYSASQPPVKAADPLVQFVSKEQYNAYPRNEISRLNNYGSFYFDPADKRIKSVEYLNSEAIAQIQTLQTEMDTVQTVKNQPSVELKRSTIVAEWESLEMTGAAADWLLRITQPHKGTSTEKGFILSFEDVPAVEQEALIQTLQQYGAAKVQLETETQL